VPARVSRVFFLIMPRRFLGLLVVAGLAGLVLANCSHRPAETAAEPAAAPAPAAADGVQQVWVQAVAGPSWVVRALTTQGQCPELVTPSARLPMTERSVPGTTAPPPGNNQPERKANVFTLRACEAPWPAGAAEVQVAGTRLQAPAAEPSRILVMGDTGCRLKASSFAYQACNDPVDWPFPAVLASGQAQRPDLVIHLGDLHYRESPCRAAGPGCAGSPWGYGDDAWQADFFRPAKALLAAAPWVFVRGNHEECARAGEGWLRYLDAIPGPKSRECIAGLPKTTPNPGDFSAPFAVPISARSQFIVFDSAASGGTPFPPEEAPFGLYREQLRVVEQLAQARPQNIMLNHHPMLAYGADLLGRAVPADSGLHSVFEQAYPVRLYTPKVQAVFNGHIHLFEALGYASDHPATVVVGNSGSAMFGHVGQAAGRAGTVAPGTQLATFITHREFGYAMLLREPGADADSWTLESYDQAGKRLARCSLKGAQLACP
jgi:hypothetical protein